MAATTDKAKKELAKDGDGGSLANVQYSMPSGGGGNRGTTNQRMPSSNMPNNSGPRVSLGGIPSPVGKVFGPTIPIGDRGSFSVGANPFGKRVGAGLYLRLKEGGKVKKMAKGGSTASKRADGCATKGKTKGRFV